MKLRHGGLAALAVLALSLPGLRASAQTGDEPSEEKTKPKEAESAAPADAVEVPPPAPPPAPEPEPVRATYIPPPATPARIENSSGSVQIGILAQPAYEIAGAPDAEKTTKNIFLRRFRLMVGGTLFKTIEFFFDADWPNLFKLDSGETGKFDKYGPGLIVQDAYVTFKPFGALIKLDAGFMLPPLSHNGLESAAKLYGGDYFVNTFRRSVTTNADPFTNAGESPVGRDLGAQLRVLAVNGHIDLRGGVFQGHRLGAVPQSTMTPATVGGLNAPRLAGRLQLNLLDAEPGFFYQGTYHGMRKIVSIGGFIDYQSPYKYFGGDVFIDLPVGPGIITVQGTFGQWDGGTYTDANGIITPFIQLPKERVMLGELGYLIGPIMLSPIVRVERLTSYARDMTTGESPTFAFPSENRYGGGLAFWPYGHNSNLKASFTRVERSPAPHAFNVINLQWQVYYY